MSGVRAAVMTAPTASAFVPAIEAMAAPLDQLPLKRIVTHRFPLERAQEAVELAQTDAAMKVVFAPNGRVS